MKLINLLFNVKRSFFTLFLIGTVLGTYAQELVPIVNPSFELPDDDSKITDPNLMEGWHCDLLNPGGSDSGREPDATALDGKYSAFSRNTDGSIYQPVDTLGSDVVYYEFTFPAWNSWNSPNCVTVFSVMDQGADFTTRVGIDTLVTPISGVVTISHLLEINTDTLDGKVLFIEVVANNSDGSDGWLGFDALELYKTDPKVAIINPSFELPDDDSKITDPNLMDGWHCDLLNPGGSDSGREPDATALDGKYSAFSRNTDGSIYQPVDTLGSDVVYYEFAFPAWNSWNSPNCVTVFSVMDQGADFTTRVGIDTLVTSISGVVTISHLLEINTDTLDGKVLIIELVANNSDGSDGWLGFDALELNKYPEKIYMEFLKAGDASLSDIALDGVSLEDFDPSTFIYYAELAEGSTIPTVTATTNDINAQLQITQAADILDTAKIVVTAPDNKTTATYMIIFWNLKLEGTVIGHEGSWGDDPTHYIAAAFDGNPSTFVDAPAAEGYVGLDLGQDKAGKLTSMRYFPRESYAYRMVGAEIRGANAEDLSDAETIYAISEEPSYGVYTGVVVSAEKSYRFIYYYSKDGYCNIAELELYGVVKSSAATLSDLQVNGETVDGFDAATFSYEVELAAGTTEVPVVTATTTDTNATAVVTDAAGLPGSTTVEVTAEDGTTKLTYTINFTVSSTGVPDFEADLITVYPTSSNSYFTVVTGSNANVIIVYDTKGKVVSRQIAQSNEEIIEITDPGIYFIQVMGKGISKSFKVIKTN